MKRMVAVGQAEARSVEGGWAWAVLGLMVLGAYLGIRSLFTYRNPPRTQISALQFR